MALDVNKLTGTHSQQLDSLKSQSPSKTNNVQQQQASQQTQTVANTQGASKDSVSLTNKAQQLHGIRERLTNTSSVDQEKVASIRKAIAAGDYKVDPEKLAANLAKFEGDLEKIF